MSDSVPPKKPQKLEPWGPKSRRHGVSVKTLGRWAESGVIAPPIIIRKRRYSPADEEPRSDDEI
jgi:hypothetical protein